MVYNEANGYSVPAKIKLQKPASKQKFSIFRGVLFGLIFAGLFSGVVYVLAAYPDSPYNFSETLTPDCAAGSSANCTVVAPAAYSFGANNFSGTGKFTGGSLTIDTNTLFVDSTNHRVGIGTLTPQKILEINDADSNTATSGIRFTDFACAGTDKLTVTSGGDLICSTDQTGGGSGNVIDTLAATLGSANDANALDITNIGKLYTALGTAGAPAFSFQTDTDTGMWSSAANTLNFSVGSGEKMRIDSTGKVGIGVTSVGYKLDVNGDVNVASGSHYKINGSNLTYSDVGAQASNTNLTSIAGLATTVGLVKQTSANVFGIDATAYLSGVVGVANGGTALSSIATGSILATVSPSTLAAVTSTSGTKVLTNASGVITWETASSGAPSFGTTTQIPYMNVAGTDFLYSSGLIYNGTTLGITTTGGTQAKLSYNGSIYSTFTTGSNGTLTVANTGGATGDIVLSPTGTGDVQLLSDSGKMYLGGDSTVNDENLKFNFATTANTVALTSTTDVSNITWTGNLTLGGNTTLGTLVTRVSSGQPADADVNGSIVINSDSADNPGIYYRYLGAWYHAGNTAGFQIPNFETTDPISGDVIKENDIVLGMVNQTYKDGGLHGIWVKWDSVKAQLLAEARGELAQAGSLAPTVATTTETMLEKVTNALTSLGISAKDGVTQITQLAVEKLTAKTARVENLEMVDKATGEIYCTWIENGEMMKAKGECGSIAVPTPVMPAEQPPATPPEPQVETPAPAPAPEEPAPAPEVQPTPEVQPETPLSPVSFLGSEIRNSVAGFFQSIWAMFFKSAPVAALSQNADVLFKNLFNTDFQVIFSAIKYATKPFSN